MKFMLAGSAGQLGSALVERLGSRIAWAGTRGELDIRDKAAVRARVADVRPDVVINATAYNNVDRAEAERDEAMAVNGSGPRHLAEAAAEAGALLVHVSTNYVFDGALRRPYTEDDPPAPLSAYGASKLAGEKAVANAGGPHLIVRTSAVYGRPANRESAGNFVARILDGARSGIPLRVVNDQEVSTTYARDLAAGIVALVDAGCRGLFHVVNEGSCTWHALAVEALAQAGLPTRVEAVTSEVMARPARRPRYSVLSTERYRSQGLPPLPEWRSALADHLANV
jgi:dTDP-4-dehydrorhamnose reductase